MKVILVEPEIAGNTGFIARVMENFNLNDLVLVNPKFDIANSKKYAVNAKEVLNNAKIIESIDKINCNQLIAFSGETTTDLNVRRAPLTTSQLIKRFKSKEIMPDIYNHNIGLVFGRESNGLSNDEIDKCGYVVTIPTTEKYRSMNLSHSIAIVLYEIYKNFLESHLDDKTRKLEKKKNREENINIKGVEFSTTLDKNLIKEFVYNLIDKVILVEHKNKVQKQVWDNIIEKSMLTKREGFNVMGFFRNLKEKIDE
ncbi:MAG: RNA methyltransferase [Candidatus Woesearchaeota archaeon]